jgi:hypothetical protein
LAVGDNRSLFLADSSKHSSLVGLILSLNANGLSTTTSYISIPLGDRGKLIAKLWTPISYYYIRISFDCCKFVLGVTLLW